MKPLDHKWQKAGPLWVPRIMGLPNPMFTGGVIKPAAAGGGGFNPPASPLVNQNFEGTGYDNSETWSEGGGGGFICDEDYTSIALVGSQSLRLQCPDFDAVHTLKTFTSSAECWAFIRMRWVTKTDGTIFFSLRDNISNALLTLTTGASNIVTVGHGSATANTVSTMTTGTEYFVWVHYLKGSGANGTGEVWFSTTSTKPADGTNGHAKTTAGTATANAAEIWLELQNFSTTKNEAIYDRVYVDDAAIGDNP